MTLARKDYKRRIIDDQIEELLKLYPNLSIEGPKWCGKTWTALAHSNSSISLDDPAKRKLAEVSIGSAFTDVFPQLIDEWVAVPEIWDEARRRADMLGTKGNYILTCSAKLDEDVWKNQIFHSGAGRFARINMHTMSLYESDESSGLVSLGELFKGKFKEGPVEEPTPEQLAYYIVRGGWPAAIKASKKSAHDMARRYIKDLLLKDIAEISNCNISKMEMFMRSLARHESTPAKIQTLVNDISEKNSNNDFSLSWNTVDDYTTILERLHIIENQPPFSPNLRSSIRVGKASIHRFVDPSLAAALLDATVDKLLQDFETFGLLFESLAIRDLRVYMDSLNGKVSHYRDNNYGDELDAVLEFDEGSFATVEIKLGFKSVPKAIENLRRFKNRTGLEPKFEMVVLGVGSYAYRDPESGVYVVPLTALKN